MGAPGSPCPGCFSPCVEERPEVQPGILLSHPGSRCKSVTEQQFERLGFPDAKRSVPREPQQY
jgi:hypothetical protein